MTVDLVSNPNLFEDIYPSDSEEESTDSDQDDSDAEDSDIVKLKTQLTDLQHQNDAQQEILNSDASSLQLLESLLKQFDNKFRVEEMKAGLDLYGQRRKALFESRQSASIEKDKIVEEITKCQKHLAKLQIKKERNEHKKLKHKAKKLAKQHRKNNKKAETKRQLKQKRVDFWPKMVYKVVVTLEVSGLTPSSSRSGSVESLVKLAQSPYSKSSSSSSDPFTATLCLSYITSSASWTPRYDVNVNTISTSGTIVYRAEMVNSTSETWRDAKIILSTSQASFSGLSDPIPSIKPWTISLQKFSTDTSTHSRQELEYSKKKFDSDDSKLTSNMTRKDLFGLPGWNEKGKKTGLESLPPGLDTNDTSSWPAWALQDYQIQLMLLEQQNKKRLLMARQDQEVQQPQQLHAPVCRFFGPAPAQTQIQANLFSQQPLGGNLFSQQHHQQQIQSQAPSGGLFGTSSVRRQDPNSVFSHAPLGGNGLFGTSRPAPPPPPPPAAFDQSNAGPLFGSSVAGTVPQPRRRGLESTSRSLPAPSPSPASDDEEDEDAATIQFVPDPTAKLEYQEATWEESGLTATYEVPGTRTIVPSFTPRRSKIATIALNSMMLTHILVPKLRPASFLRARITNNSPVTLLKGTAGLTLDGSFLGHTTIPRCSAGETFPLQLGVDPALSIAYASPAVRKNVASGVFNKESSMLYTRTMTLTNTRTTGSPIEISVRDQVPVSEDERLKVEIAHPKGLQAEGDTARTGTEFFSAQTQKVGGGTAGGRSSAKEKDDKWGQATARLGKNGGIEWSVKLNPGKGVRLTLEYELRYPSGEGLRGN